MCKVFLEFLCALSLDFYERKRPVLTGLCSESERQPCI